MNTNVSEILTDAYKTKRPNKEQARSIILNIVRQSEDTDDFTVNYHNMKELLAFFNPVPPKLPKNSWNFCAMAVNEMDIRPFLTRIYAHRNIGLVGSNGMVTCWVDEMWMDEDVEYERYYNLDGTPMPKESTENWKFPDLFNILEGMGISDPNTVETERTRLIDLVKDVQQLGSVTNTTVKIGDRWYNYKLVETASAGSDVVNLYQTKSGSIYVNPRPGWHAIVMPLNNYNPSESES